MAIISRKYSIENFNNIVLGLRVLLKETEGQDESSVYFHNWYNKMLGNIFAYSYTTSQDIKDNEIVGYVYTRLTEEEMETVRLAVYLSGRASVYGIEFVDYTNELIRKNEEFLQERRAERQKISNLYAEYLESDLVNDKGKKTKVLFYETYGVSASMLNSALEEFPL